MRYGDVGGRIKEKRKEKKLTQAQLAELIGKTESSIRKYEKNLVEIPSEVMEKIAEVLDTSVNYLDGIDLIIAEQTKYNALGDIFKELGFVPIIAEIPGCNHLSALISYNDKTISIENDEFVRLQDDIYKYIKFRILDLFDKE